MVEISKKFPHFPGTCGSACNYFATKMTLEEKAYAVSVGGIMGMILNYT
jgi:hypothetical protein